MNPRYARQSVLSWVGPAGQDRIEASRVAVVGTGALGCASAALLARAGVSRLVLVDRDFVELSNLQRQILFTEEDAEARLPKAVAASKRLRAVRADLDVEALDADLDAELARRLFSECDLVLDGTDNFETRYLLNDAAVEAGKTWIYAGAVGMSGAVAVVRPGDGPCLRCLFPAAPKPGSAPTCETAGILGPVAAAAASIQAAEALKLLAGRPDLLAPGYLSFDLLSGTFTRVSAGRDPGCPCCASRRFEFLQEEAGTRTHRVCGRDGIIILAPKGTRVDLPALAKRLEAVAPVFSNSYLLQTEWEGHPVTLYGDGRALVQRTDDPARARALYARYLGM
jgi:molybdopterin/thiamine biosynthesis adenylyltransferase